MSFIIVVVLWGTVPLASVGNVAVEESWWVVVVVVTAAVDGAVVEGMVVDVVVILSMVGSVFCGNSTPFSCDDDSCDETCGLWFVVSLSLLLLLLLLLL